MSRSRERQAHPHSPRRARRALPQGSPCGRAWGGLGPQRTIRILPTQTLDHGAGPRRPRRPDWAPLRLTHRVDGISSPVARALTLPAPRSLSEGHEGSFAASRDQSSAFSPANTAQALLRALPDLGALRVEKNLDATPALPAWPQTRPRRYRRQSPGKQTPVIPLRDERLFPPPSAS